MSDDTQMRGIIGNAATGMATALQNLSESATAAATAANSLKEEMQRGERQGKHRKSVNEWLANPTFGILPPADWEFAPARTPHPHKSRKPRQRRAASKVAAHAKTRRKTAGQSRRKNRKR